MKGRQRADLEANSAAGNRIRAGLVTVADSEERLVLENGANLLLRRRTEYTAWNVPPKCFRTVTFG